MTIISFQVESFRNLKLAECSNVPSFMVICGGNGCGKSALLEALMTAKERAGAYGNFNFDPRAVSVDADKSLITMIVAFSEEEREFVRERYNESCPEQDEIAVEITKGGGGRALKRSQPVSRLFSFYGRFHGSPGFFDYITAERQTRKVQLQNWDASFMSDERTKGTLAAGPQKFELTKQYLAGLKMRDLQAIQTSQREGNLVVPDSLQEIRDTFNRFFAPLVFKDVYIDRTPFEFVVSTPLGEIDIDDLSSGEKEIFNIFVRFHQLNPSSAVILLDEADAHLHPDLERRYLGELRKLARGNQLMLTTHSPEMMIAAGSDSLYSLLKEPQTDGGNQLVRVTEDQHLHDVLSDLMGSRGLVSFNQRIIFIEGEYASTDRAIYEAFYPPSQYNLSFVPAGNSATVRKAAEQVNALLSASVGFQQYFSIVDRDIIRAEDDPTSGTRLFRLPVYHVENFLIDEGEILEVTKVMLSAKCPFNDAAEVQQCLKDLLLSDGHLKPFARALLDAELSAAAKAAYDAVYKESSSSACTPTIPNFESVEARAREWLADAIEDNTWREICKGRDLLKAYCGDRGLKYDHFRNILISRLKSPPQALDEIMEKILA